jgi:hypothetical protein
MDENEVQELIPLVEVLLTPLEKDEGRSLLQHLIGVMGPGKPSLDAEDVKRAVSREKNILASRMDGPLGGRPNLVDEYVNSYRESINEGDKEKAVEIRKEVRENMSRSSYYKFTSLAGISEEAIAKRGRPTKVDTYIDEYRKLKEDGNRKEARSVLEKAKDELSPSSYYKLLRELHLKKKAGVGRPSKVELFQKAYRDHMRDGNTDFAESVLDYAKSKLSRSSFFKLKKRIREMDYV